MDVIFIFEIIGAVAFALSGAFVAIQRRLDYFGIVVLALITAVGGGMLRDIILGITPPHMFRDPVYCLTAVVMAMLVILVNHFEHLELKEQQQKLLRKIVLIFDAMGLSIFSIVGVEIALTKTSDNMFLAVFVGVLTGIGGGILRDMMAGRTPLVLRKEIYALASLLGCVLFYYMRMAASESLSMYVSVALIFVIRLYAVIHGVNLPQVNRGAANARRQRH
ncbi:MAG TPA: trimeric intracellular cation channel family protein [Bacteroidota bacterium]|nr:trimeric intracellular cation channel family protein [Bacteroidota bacterium]